MINLFKIEQYERLRIVKRWGIIDMMKEQSVMEHSYMVAVIVGSLIAEHTKLCSDLRIRTLVQNHRQNAIEWALMHDLPEIFTGDIPSSIKRNKDVAEAVIKAETDEMPAYGDIKNVLTPLIFKIIKMADYIEAINFANKYCIDVNKHNIISEMERKLVQVAYDCDDEYGTSFQYIMNFTEEARRNY